MRFMKRVRLCWCQLRNHAASDIVSDAVMETGDGDVASEAVLV